jgi:O-antigen ligase
MKKSDKFILLLFYLYSFILSFENVLEEVWDIKTQYKPFRVLALVIGLAILATRRFRSLNFFTNDLKLVGVYLFGLIPTFVALLINRLNEDYFWSTSLQYFIVLWIFLLIKNIPFEFKHVQNALKYFCFGAVFNGLYMIYNFAYVDIGRQSGFMDDSNIAAMGCCVAFAYYFYYFVRPTGPILSVGRLFYGLLSMIMVVALFVAGSRSAMISLAIILLFLLYYKASLQRKLWHSAFLAVVLFFVFNSSESITFFKVLPAWDRLISLEGKEDSRVSLWKYGFDAFEETHFVGLGIEQFKNPVNYTKFVKVSENATVINQRGLVVHNTFLTVLYEYGIISFVLFISFFWTLFVKLKQVVLHLEHPMIYQLVYFNMVWFSIFLSSFQSHSMWFLYIILGLVIYSKSSADSTALNYN